MAIFDIIIIGMLLVQFFFEVHGSWHKQQLLYKINCIIVLYLRIYKDDKTLVTFIDRIIFIIDSKLL